MAETLTADALAGAIRERLQATHVVRRAPDAQPIYPAMGRPAWSDIWCWRARPALAPRTCW